MSGSPHRGRVVAVLLAAGAAQRYGRAKQIETYEGVSLVRAAAQAALAVADEVIVVTGAHAETVEAELAGLPLRILCNTDWALGMGRSIAAAFTDLLQKQGNIEAALLCLADQPLVRAPQLQKLIEASGGQRDRIIVSDYGAQHGPPCLLPAHWFPELANLSGDTGARSILKRHADKVMPIAMPEAAVDVDTPDDLIRLQP